MSAWEHIRSAPVYACGAFTGTSPTSGYRTPTDTSTAAGGPNFFVRQHACKTTAEDAYNPTTRFQASDFYIGAKLPVLLQMRRGYEAEGPKMFLLTEADTWTLDFMESEPGTFPSADYEHVKDSILTGLSFGDRAEQFVQLLEERDSKKLGFVYTKTLHVRPISGPTSS